jgi:hypothetical protein
MGKYEMLMDREDLIKEINMTLEEVESGVLPDDVAKIVLYEALVSAYYYIVKNEEE